MVKRHVCPNCGSDDCDFVDVGLPNALTCIDCGTTFPYELTLFPKVIKTDVVKTDVVKTDVVKTDVVKTKPFRLPKGVEGSSPNAWPFPTKLPSKKPNDELPDKYNPNNEEDAPL